MMFDSASGLHLLDSREHQIIVLLVDDQLIFAEAVRKMLVEEKDITFHYCQNPTQAVELAKQLCPTVILQDLMMPQIDGLTLLREYRLNKETRDIPKVVLSTKEEPKIKAEAFSLGANDYLVKLPDKIELIARIRYHSKSYIHLLERNEAYEKLIQSKKILISELEEAADYVRVALPSFFSEGEVLTEWVFIPSQHLGGDAFGYHWLDEENFAFYLIDVCGHGVGAALLSISVMNALRLQTLPSTNFHDPKAVLTSLNKHFPMEKHKEMFFTMWYGVYRKKDREICFSSGGHPPAIFFTGPSLQDSKIHLLKTEGMVIGGMEGTLFHNQIQKVESFAQLYVFSDGIFELLQADNTYLEYEEFVQVLRELSLKGKGDVQSIKQWACEVRRGKEFEDDLSLVKFDF